MFKRHTVIFAILVGVILAAALVGPLEAPASTTFFTAVAAVVLVAVIPWAAREKQFPGVGSSLRARRALGLAYAIILGAAGFGISGVHLDRTTAVGLRLLILAVGSASVILGSAAVLLDRTPPTGTETTG
jgi:membrane protease YdiL (CAAX protease family)